MARIQRRDFLSSELAAVESRYEAIANDPVRVFDAVGLRSRIRELRSELETTEAQPVATAEALLYFYGAPVKEEYGIDAKFSGEALRAYQDLVSKEVAAQRGPLSRSGPIPDEGKSHLHITDVVHGSFGFQLEEIPDAEPTLFKSPLAHAVENVSELLSAAAESDEAFAERMADADERVIDSLKAFVSFIHFSGAQLRIKSHASEITLDAEGLAAANERVSAEWSESADEPFPGTFWGALSGSRRFEHQVAGTGEVIRGKVADGVNIHDLDTEWHEQHCVAHMRVLTLIRGAKQYKSYTLLGIAPLPPQNS